MPPLPLAAHIRLCPLFQLLHSPPRHLENLTFRRFYRQTAVGLLLNDRQLSMLGILVQEGRRPLYCATSIQNLRQRGA
jgi:hypothetical protein